MKKINGVFGVVCGMMLALVAGLTPASAQVFRFPKAASQFPNFLNPYSPVNVPKPVLTNKIGRAHV